MDPLQKKEREGRIFHDKDSEPATRQNLQEGGSKLTQGTRGCRYSNEKDEACPIPKQYDDDLERAVWGYFTEDVPEK